MAKPKLVKCKYCKAEIEKDKAYNPNPKMYYCSEEHYNLFTKLKEKPKDNKTNDVREYTDYIQALYLSNGFKKEQINWMLIMKQTKNLLEEHTNWKHYTISYVLDYMINIAKVNVFDYEQGTILNLIPYYFQEAERYFKETCEIIESAEVYEKPREKVYFSADTFKSKYRTIDISEV